MEGLASAVIGATLSLLMMERGGQLNAAPGEAVSITLAGQTIEPFALMVELRTGKIKAEDWTRQCGELGITGVDLSGVAQGAREQVAR